MKLNLKPDDLKVLTDSQKKYLNNIWMPKKNDLVVSFICKDVNEEIYEPFEFVIGEILFEEINEESVFIAKNLSKIEKHHQITLRSLKLYDDNIFNEEVELLNIEAELDMDFTSQQDHFDKEDCLPLLNIGQIIELLKQFRYGVDGFAIDVDFSSECKFILTNAESEEFEGKELINLLWLALKTKLS